MVNRNKLIKFLDKFKSATILTIGDIIADEYIYGSTSRVSREAPVLILSFDSEHIFLGGGGNALNNLKSLGCKVIPVGVVGSDYFGKIILSNIKKMGIPAEGIFSEKNRVTTRKTRILAGGYHTTKQQVIRIDREPDSMIKNSTEEKIINFLDSKIKKVDAVMVSDYGLGLLSPAVIDKINNMAKNHTDTIITVDSRFNLSQFRNVSAVTPNEPEASECAGIAIGDEDNGTLNEAGKKLMEMIDQAAVLITRGRKGMRLFEKNGRITSMPIFGSDEIADVTGAGDTVISVFTLSLVAGATLEEAMNLANYAAGIVVMKRGTATVTQKELKDVLNA
ncbi:MAG: hypothetical protein A3G31_04230 [Candidatus Schekmanbacteria bacterium RIFCSPLOWO2_12_FULL_38_15]|uniref:Carbohydrate kinase PfkB domain-containing protein n=1 Tax=Candidatus Schekmanbacteria bacterium RIFCSPLOWO2_12_FULL_38_15 TaxID=1817883 RepID=A0A1F7SLD3_9BACT|nr:MAG: hypothetical protein A3G31_04230 [Candidatus Schekmanbacteria bacterium RIFCSPLOWO2_12_FULL_38_15]